MFISAQRLPEKVITNLITYADVTKSNNTGKNEFYHG